MPFEKPVLKCEHCKLRSREVRKDPVSCLLLCNECWAKVDPRAHGCREDDDR